jgi:hypothetical protein
MHKMSLIKQLTAVLLVSFLILPPAPVSAKSRKGDKLLAEARTDELRGDYDKALELAEQALAVDPSDPAYLLMVRRVRFEAGVMHVKNGQKLRNDGKLPEALAEFEKAYATDPASDIAEQEIRRTKEMIERVKTGAQPQAEGITPQDLRTLTPAQLARKETQQKIDSLQPVPELRALNSEPIGLKMMNKPRVLFETVSPASTFCSIPNTTSSRTSSRRRSIFRTPRSKTRSTSFPSSPSRFGNRWPRTPSSSRSTTRKSVAITPKKWSKSSTSTTSPARRKCRKCLPCCAPWSTWRRSSITPRRTRSSSAAKLTPWRWSKS